MAFAARRSLVARLSHHLTRRLHPATPHLLASHSSDEPPNPSPPPRLPPFHSPLPHCSRAGQTLNHLHPFSLIHFQGPHRRSFSSAAPAPDASAPIDAAAGVLADAVAAVPAPFPGEVAAAAADSLVHIAALQHVIDAIHTFTGLNCADPVRDSSALPLLVNQLKATQKLNAIRPEMEAIKDEMNAMDPKSAQEGKKKMGKLFQKHGVSPFTPLKGLLIQGPVFVSFLFAIRNMVDKVPSLKGGGTLWFTDLTTPDDLYIFPVLTALTFLLTVELNLQEGMEGNPMAGKMKYFSRGMALMTVPFTISFAKAIPAAESPAAIMEAPQSSLEQPDAAALGYQVKNLEKKVKSRGKSRRRRLSFAILIPESVEILSYCSSGILFVTYENGKGEKNR
ncbi:hypothetical protein ABZP36_031276 [Zizania latifolia]